MLTRTEVPRLPNGRVLRALCDDPNCDGTLQPDRMFGHAIWACDGRIIPARRWVSKSGTKKTTASVPANGFSACDERSCSKPRGAIDFSSSRFFCLSISVLPLASANSMPLVRYSIHDDANETTTANAAKLAPTTISQKPIESHAATVIPQSVAWSDIFFATFLLLLIAGSATSIILHIARRKKLRK